MTTVLDLVNDAAGDAGLLGLGQSLLPEDVNKIFRTANQMLYQWNRDRLMVYALVTQGITSTGAQSYTVGPSGTFNTGTNQRPSKIESAFLRQPVSGSTPVDYPLSPIFSREDYNQIGVKQLGSFPNWYFYDTAFPLGNIYFWPIPQASIYELYITHRVVLSQFTSLQQTIVLPGEYEAAIRYSLALRICAMYRFPATPELDRLAKGALAIVKPTNYQPSQLQMPKGTPGVSNRSNNYNIYSDTGG